MKQYITMNYAVRRAICSYAQAQRVPHSRAPVMRAHARTRIVRVAHTRAHARALRHMHMLHVHVHQPS